MTTAHVTPELLAAYADGSMSDGMSLLVASHLTYCPECRSRVARLEAVGGAFIAVEEPEAPDPACLSRVLERLDTGMDEPNAPQAVGSDLPLPRPILARLGPEASDIHWRFLLPGLSDHKLSGFDGEDVSLLRAKPGVRILPHTHSGDEATLVLTGQLRDGERIYGRGDVALADEHDNHRPEIVGDETCICLVVLTGRMRFTGPIGRALNLLNG